MPQEAVFYPPSSVSDYMHRRMDILQDRIKDLEDRIRALETKKETLEEGKAIDEAIERTAKMVDFYGGCSLDHPDVILGG